MSEVQTLGVLRDAFALGMVALAIALGVYAWIRAKTGQCWNYEGNVLTRAYDYGDGLIALILMGFFAMAFVAAAPAPNGGAAETASKPEAASVFGLVVNEMFMVGLCIALLMYLRFFRDLSPAELFGLRNLRPAAAAGWAALWVVGAWVVINAAILFLMWMHHPWPQDAPQELVQEFADSPSVIFKLALAVTAIGIAPLTEELIFRGFFYGITKRFTDRWFACLLTSLMFALVHHNVGTLLPLFILAIGFSIAYEVTGCLLVPMFMHSMFNAFNVIELARS